MQLTDVVNEMQILINVWELKIKNLKELKESTGTRTQTAKLNGKLEGLNIAKNDLEKLLNQVKSVVE